MNNLDFKLSRRRRDENGEWTCGKVFAVAAKGNSTTQSNPTTSTSITDQRVAASEGSVSAGSGASVAISTTTTDPQAFDAIAHIANSANDLGEKAVTGAVDAAKASISGNVAALQEGADLGKVAINSNVSVIGDALDFGDSVVQKAINAATSSQQSANDLIQHTNDSFTAKLASNAGPAPTAVADNLVKYITIASGVIGLALLFRGEKK